MKDNEIGKLWQQIHNEQACTPAAFEWTRDLIRKLVEERAFHNNKSIFNEHEQSVFLKDALRDFHIPEDSWQEKN